MRLITIGRKQGKKEWELVFGPNTPLTEQLNFHTSCANSPHNKVWEEIQIWRQEHHKRPLNFMTPEEHSAKLKELARAEEEAKALKEADDARIAEKTKANALKEEAAHKARVAEVSKANDTFRNAIQTATAQAKS